MGVTADKRADYFVVFLMLKQIILQHLNWTNHEGGTLPGFIAEGIDPILSDIVKPEQIVLYYRHNG